MNKNRSIYHLGKNKFASTNQVFEKSEKSNHFNAKRNHSESQFGTHTSRASIREQRNKNLKKRNQQISIFAIIILFIGFCIPVIALLDNSSTKKQNSVKNSLANASAKNQSERPQLQTSSATKECIIQYKSPYNETEYSAGKTGELFTDMPILSPVKEKNLIFSGWWNKPQKKVQQSDQRTIFSTAQKGKAQRINEAKEIKCPTSKTNSKVNTNSNSQENDLILYAWFVPSNFNSINNIKVPILMYHWFTNSPAGAYNKNPNYIYTGNFEKQMKYLSENDFYFPSWSELNAFIDNKIFLPKKSVIVSDDDTQRTWLSLGIPIVKKYKIYCTSFAITRFKHYKAQNKWIQIRSHSNYMHIRGVGGIGRMLTLPYNDIVKDLQESVKKLNGVAQVFAYPFGQYNKTAQRALTETGFSLAVTVNPGKVSQNSQKLALPRMRISYGTSFSSFLASVL